MMKRASLLLMMLLSILTVVMSVTDEEYPEFDDDYTIWETENELSTNKTKDARIPVGSSTLPGGFSKKSNVQNAYYCFYQTLSCAAQYRAPYSLRRRPRLNAWVVRRDCRAGLPR